MANRGVAERAERAAVPEHLRPALAPVDDVTPVIDAKDPGARRQVRGEFAPCSAREPPLNAASNPREPGGAPPNAHTGFHEVRPRASVVHC